MTSSFDEQKKLDGLQTGNEAQPARSVGTSRYSLLDCWRGIACLMVVLAHSSEVHCRRYSEDGVPVVGLIAHCVAFLPNLGMGVLFFFVISGYCISATVDGRGQKPGSVSNYFSRRFWRIYPPYWAMFILMAIAVISLDFMASRGWIPGSLYNSQSPLTLAMPQLFGNVTLTETWRFHLFGEERKLFLKHAWTLCYEEQFYLIVGLTLLMFPNAFFRSMIGATVLSLALLVLSVFQFIDVSGFGIDLLWHPFAIGVLVYYRLRHARANERPFIDYGLLAVAIVSTFAVFLPWNANELSERILIGLRVSSIFALVLIALYKWDRVLLTKMPFRILASVGRISYSLYLVHAPVVPVMARVLQKMGIDSATQTLFVTIPMCVGFSIPVAWVFFLLFERPFLRGNPGIVSTKSSPHCANGDPQAVSQIADELPIAAPSAVGLSE